MPSRGLGIDYPARPADPDRRVESRSRDRLLHGAARISLKERRDDLKFAHIDTNVPGLQIGLNEVAAPKGSGSIVLNISVANVKEARAQLEARGVKFRGETVIIPGKVALAEFADPDNNVLRFAGPPPPKSAGPR